MNFFREYRPIIGLIVFAGIISLIVLNFTTVTHGISRVIDAVMPLVIGLCTAFILNIVVTPFERIYFPKSQKPWVAKTRRPVCIVLAILAVLLILALVGSLALPQLAHSLTIVVNVLPMLYHDFQNYINQHTAAMPFLVQNQVMNSVSPDSILQNVSKVGADGGRYLMRTMGQAFEMIINVGIGLIFAIYVLAQKDTLAEQIERLLRVYGGGSSLPRLRHVLSVANDVFSKFIIGQFLDALILGIMVGIALGIAGVSYALPIGCVVGLTALVPLLGSYIGGAMGALMLLAASPMQALMFIIILVVMQQIEGNLIYPRIVGGSVGLPGIWVFAAITLGGALYGILGILISVPLAATIYRLVREDVAARIKKI